MCRVLSLLVLTCLEGLGALEQDGTCTAASGCSTYQENVLLQKPPSLLRSRSNASSEVVSDIAVESAKACYPHKISRRRRASVCSCRRRNSAAIEDLGTGWKCKGFRMVATKEEEEEQEVKESGPEPEIESPLPGKEAAPQGGESSPSNCLCVFDIDRTLTGRQGDTQRCLENDVLPVHDRAYSGGQATLSALSKQGIASTFCNACHLGITSAGRGSGPRSSWNHYILNEIMRGEVHDAFTQEHPDHKRWSYGTDVRSPYVLAQKDGEKQDAVELIRQWYQKHDVDILPSEVFFFGDRVENIMPFQEKQINSREVSCASRDESHGGGMIGYCGATPAEIRREVGNFLCE